MPTIAIREPYQVETPAVKPAEFDVVLIQINYAQEVFRVHVQPTAAGEPHGPVQVFDFTDIEDGPQDWTAWTGKPVEAALVGLITTVLQNRGLC